MFSSPSTCVEAFRPGAATRHLYALEQGQGSMGMELDGHRRARFSRTRCRLSKLVTRGFILKEPHRTFPNKFLFLAEKQREGAARKTHVHSGMGRSSERHQIAPPYKASAGQSHIPPPHCSHKYVISRLHHGFCTAENRQKCRRNGVFRFCLCARSWSNTGSCILVARSKEASSFCSPERMAWYSLFPVEPDVPWP